MKVSVQLHAPATFPQGEKPQGLRDGVNVVMKRKIPARNRTKIMQPASSHFTELSPKFGRRGGGQRNTKFYYKEDELTVIMYRLKICCNRFLTYYVPFTVRSHPTIRRETIYVT